MGITALNHLRFAGLLARRFEIAEESALTPPSCAGRDRVTRSRVPSN